MPLYEYYCSNCKSRFELLVSHRHANDIVCIKCHSEKVRRLLSLFALPHNGEDDGSYQYDDTAPSLGSCACGNSDCGCH